MNDDEEEEEEEEEEDGFVQPESLFHFDTLQPDIRGNVVPFQYPTSEPSPSGTAWMVTFADLVSLMLAFFVLQFSMSELPIKRWQGITQAFSRHMKLDNVTRHAIPSAEFNQGWTFQRQAIDLDYLAVVLKKTIADEPKLAELHLTLKDNRLLISLPGDLLFKDSDTVMTTKAREAISQLGTLLRNVANKVGVMGHMNSTLPTGSPFSSNWEMSMVRAAKVANALRDDGYPDDIAVYGVGQLSGASQGPEHVDIIILPAATGS